MSATETITGNDKIAFLIRAVENARSDDLERAQNAFRGLTDKELDEQHGHSGKTRRQILAEYEAHRQLYYASRDLVNSMIARFT